MFANIGDLTSNVISSEKNLPLRIFVILSDTRNLQWVHLVALVFSLRMARRNFPVGLSPIFADCQSGGALSSSSELP